MPDDIIEREVLGEAAAPAAPSYIGSERGLLERVERPLASSANTPRRPFRTTLKRFSEP